MSENTTPVQAFSDIAVIGGGMVGRSLALLLVKSLPSASVSLIDATPAPATPDDEGFDRRVTAISQGSVAILARLGVWPQLERAAASIHEVQVSDRGHSGWTHYDAQEDPLGELGFVVENTVIGETLYRACTEQDALRQWQGTKVTALDIQEGGAVLHLDTAGGTREHLKAGLVVIADGAQSELARTLGIGFERHDYRQTAWVANVQHSEPHQGCAYERFTEAGPLALLPMNDFERRHRSALVWTRSSDLPLDDSDDALLEALQTQFGWRLGQFNALGKRSHYPLSLLLAREQVRRHVVLMGNSAHFLHPVAGQGFNLALRDADVLVQTLSQAAQNAQPFGSLDVLERYLSRRKTDQWLTTNLSHTFIQWFTSEHTARRATRNGALGLMNALPSLRRRFFRQMMGQGQHG